MRVWRGGGKWAMILQQTKDKRLAKTLHTGYSAGVGVDCFTKKRDNMYKKDLNMDKFEVRL